MNTIQITTGKIHLEMLHMHSNSMKFSGDSPTNSTNKQTPKLLVNIIPNITLDKVKAAFNLGHTYTLQTPNVHGS